MKVRVNSYIIGGSFLALKFTLALVCIKAGLLNHSHSQSIAIHSKQAPHTQTPDPVSCTLADIGVLPPGFSKTYSYLPLKLGDDGNPCRKSSLRSALSRRFHALLDSLPAVELNQSTAPGTMEALRRNAPFGEMLKMYIVDSLVAFTRPQPHRLLFPKDKLLKGYSWLQNSIHNKSIGIWQNTFRTREPGTAQPFTKADIPTSGKRLFDFQLWAAAHLAHRTLQLSSFLEKDAASLIERMHWPKGKTVIGLHVRRGDACVCDKNETRCKTKPQGGGRCCPTLRKYVKGVQDLSRALNTRYVAI